jgi:hypothetical protein
MQEIWYVVIAAVALGTLLVVSVVYLCRSKDYFRQSSVVKASAFQTRLG